MAQSGPHAARDRRASPADLNRQIAARLREAADLYARQGANPFRTSAYRRAADTIDGLPEGVDHLIEREGMDGLVRLPGIGRGIAAAIVEMVRTGRWSTLDRLRGAVNPEQLFQAVPGIGPELARRIHETLQIDRLEDLEAAAHDGRLARVPGLGRRRIQAIAAALAQMLARPRRRPRPPEQEPPVDMLLEVDREYREKAAAGKLPTIAPRRFNPAGEAWLPVLHTSRDGWHFTALYSNTARAHELGRTRDWVVIYFYDHDHGEEGQRTVVTESRGRLAGHRVVRGREAECMDYYAGGGEQEGS